MERICGELRGKLGSLDFEGKRAVLSKLKVLAEATRASVKVTGMVHADFSC